MQQAAVETEPGARQAAFALLATSNSAGEAAWQSFQRLSVDLPGEDTLVGVFEADRDGGLGASGSSFSRGPVTSVTEFAHVAELSNAMLADLNLLKALYQRQVQLAVHADQPGSRPRPSAPSGSSPGPCSWSC